MCWCTPNKRTPWCGGCGPFLTSKYTKLREAVRELYYGAVWKSDRLSTEQEIAMWEAVRDAAGFKPGETAGMRRE